MKEKSEIMVNSKNENHQSNRDQVLDQQNQMIIFDKEEQEPLVKRKSRVCLGFIISSIALSK